VCVSVCVCVFGVCKSLRHSLSLRAAVHSTDIFVSSCCYICVLILLCMCPHTAMYVSSYCYIICVLIAPLGAVPRAPAAQPSSPDRAARDTHAQDRRHYELLDM
jgi:hypothetical protein